VKASGRRGGRALAAAVVLGACVVACVHVDDGDHATMSVTPAVALMDRPVTVSLTGLGAGRVTTVTASAQDTSGVRWSASAEFRASRDGTLDLGATPLRGAYAGSDPMGLFRFMTPDAPGAIRFFALSVDRASYDVVLEAEVEGRTVATAKATRELPQGVGVTRKELTVDADGVFGTLFQPKDASTRKPALLVFGGSEGGLASPVALKAALLAAHGYPTLALAYFAERGLPATLVRIPMEYFRKALMILRAQPGVDTAHLLVTGASYGGEGSLLVAATYPDLVNGVIAEVPNSYVDAGRGDPPPHSAWTLGGKDLPFAIFGLPAAEVDPRTYIPLDRIRGPIMVACGALDTVWPSCRNVDDITARLRGRAGVTALKYRDAGHFVGVFPPYTPTTDEALTNTGGNVRGTLTANENLHARILALLAEQ
jgi:dienelactone hydrolase